MQRVIKCPNFCHLYPYMIFFFAFGIHKKVVASRQLFYDDHGDPYGSGEIESNNEKGEQDWRKIGLEMHNTLRRKHAVADLQRDIQLEKTAQKYAEHLAASHSFDHSTDNDFGENLMLTSADNEVEAVKDAVDSWYEEIKDYDYKKPGYKEDTSHFTTMLWRATTHMGLGIAWDEKEEQFVVVANYKPGGNVDGEYQDNVFPLKSD